MEALANRILDFVPRIIAGRMTFADWWALSVILAMGVAVLGHFQVARRRHECPLCKRRRWRSQMTIVPDTTGETNRVCADMDDCIRAMEANALPRPGTRSDDRSPAHEDAPQAPISGRVDP